MLANYNTASPALHWERKQSNAVKPGFLPRERRPAAATRSFNLSFPVGGVVYTPDMRIKFGQIEHISGVPAAGVQFFSLFQCSPAGWSWLQKKSHSALKIPSFEYNAGTHLWIWRAFESRNSSLDCHQDVRAGTAPQNNKRWTVGQHSAYFTAYR